MIIPAPQGEFFKLRVFLGYMVSCGASGGFVRSFAMKLDGLKETEQRCNHRYDTLLVKKELRETQEKELPKKGKKQHEQQAKQENRGILGECVLRDCTMFDVGLSFMSDSLHNVYIGAFVSALSLFAIVTEHSR